MKTFDLAGAADFLNISDDTLKDMAGSGVVPGAKVGKAWIFTDESLESYLRDEIQKQTAERKAKHNPVENTEPAEQTSSTPTAYARTFGSISRRRARTPPPLT